MELFFLSGVILFAFIASLSVVFLLYHKSYASHPNLPRGKMGLPFIGESLEYLSTGRKGHPEKFFYDRMAKFSPKSSRLRSLESQWLLCVIRPETSSYIPMKTNLSQFGGQVL
ncbi:beta-amyrin 28-monooxygenase [Quercus suber]|uniref:Beta-amyrin 28-monooxygenase n=1 Tax=Quercus suber TaxID=58331 RepID=A0AAW0JI79_QUESU